MIKIPISKEDNEDCWNLVQEFDWIQKMKNTPQDRIYHAEGDVHIHTKMVLDALVDDDVRLVEIQDRLDGCVD